MLTYISARSSIFVLQDPSLENHTITMSAIGTFFLVILSFACNLGGLAFAGFLDLIVGHAILRATHHAGYDLPLNGSMKIGAVGGVVGGIALSLALSCLGRGGDDDDDEKPKAFSVIRSIISVPTSTVFGAVAGALGSVILAKHGLRDEILNPSHAASAGALGGVILGPGFLVATMVIALVFNASPIRFACGTRRNISTSY